MHAYGSCACPLYALCMPSTPSVTLCTPAAPPLQVATAYMSQLMPRRELGRHQRSQLHSRHAAECAARLDEAPQREAALRGVCLVGCLDRVAPCRVDLKRVLLPRRRRRRRRPWIGERSCSCNGSRSRRRSCWRHRRWRRRRRRRRWRRRQWRGRRPVGWRGGRPVGWRGGLGRAE